MNRKGPCYIDSYGDLCYENGTVMNDPSVCIVPNSDIILKYGDTQFTEEYMSTYNANAALLGFDLAIVVSLNAIPKRDAAYIINRMVNYTLSGFIRNFFEHINLGGIDQWLEQEQKRVPLE